MTRLWFIALAGSVMLLLCTAGASDCNTITTSRMILQISIALPVTMLSLWQLRDKLF